MSPRIISHRGKVDLSSPENDLIGIQQAIELGVDMVEFDVRRTSDDVLVCHHDAKVDGVAVSNLSYNMIKDNNKHLCKVDEVLSLCKGKIGVNLEIKEAGFETRVVDMLVSNFSYEDIYVTSFLPSVIRSVKELDKIAYIRFASVYTNFKEIGEFGEYIEELDGQPKKKF